MQTQVMQGVLRSNWRTLMAGFVAGAYHVAVYFFLSTGNAPGRQALLPFLFFGYGSLLWFVVPPFQYAYYAYVARHRLKTAAWINVVLHYGSAVVLMIFFRSTGSFLPEPASSAAGTNLLTLALFFGPFIVLNAYFFRRVFGRTVGGASTLR